MTEQCWCGEAYDPMAGSMTGPTTIDHLEMRHDHRSLDLLRFMDELSDPAYSRFVDLVGENGWELPQGALHMLTEDADGDGWGANGQSSSCLDCDVRPWLQLEDGRVVHEDFYVTEELWDATVPDDHVRRWVEDGVRFGEGRGVLLCIGCFEKRLGRRLTREDFDVREPGPLWGVPPSRRYLARIDAGT